MVTVDDFAEVVLSGVPRKASRTDCCCRHHKRSGGPTVPDSNRLGLPHGHPARPKQPWWPGPPAGVEPTRTDGLGARLGATADDELAVVLFLFVWVL